MALYPLKFKPIYKDKIWGGEKIRSILNKDFSPLPNCGESWEISAVQGNVSIVENGYLKGNSLQELVEIYMGDMVGQQVYERFGMEFPLLIKFIDAADKLSIQVHPDDKLASKRHNAYGKTEMWYVMEADAGSELIVGFNQKMDKADYVRHVKTNSLKDILNREPVQNGDVFFIPAGRVHAIGAGILLAEIQQTSDVTYRIYDWDRKGQDGKARELHTDLAVDAIDYSYHDNYKTQYKGIENQRSDIVKCPFFETNIIHLTKPLVFDYNQVDSFVIYICVEGQFELGFEDAEHISIKQGESLLIPAEIEEVRLLPVLDSKILEVSIPQQT